MRNRNKLIIFFLLLIQTISSQEINNVSVFNRFLILNPKNEIMVVKIKGTDFWVTPGVYQNSKKFIKQAANNMASSYGIKVSSPKLKGVFLLKRELNQKQSTSLRNIFIVRMIDGKTILPKGIEKVKWLSLKKAQKLITFPHINAMINQIMQNRSQIWGGSILQYKEGNQFRSKILEEFYPL